MQGQRPTGRLTRIDGSIRSPQFLLAWTATVMLAMVQLQPADAMLPRATEFSVVRVAPAVIDIDPVATELLSGEADGEALLRGLRGHSAVLSGRWQPRAAVRGAPARVVPAASSEPAAAPPAEIQRVAAPAIERRVAPLPTLRTAAPGQIREFVPPRESSAYLTAKRLARTALGAGRAAEAYRLLRPGVGRARDDSEYLGLLAVAALRVGARGEAAVLYRRLAMLEPATERWALGLAMAEGAGRIPPGNPAEAVAPGASGFGGAAAAGAAGTAPDAAAAGDTAPAPAAAPGLG